MATLEAEIKIFVSYRRSDDIGFVGRLTDRLSSVYGEKNVFRDISGLRSGEDFEKRIGSKLSEATVVIAVIGAGWVGRRLFRTSRILTASDWVRKELEHALASETPVIPILLGDAVLPTRAQLPVSLRGLLAVQTGRIRDASWENDSSALIRAIDAVAQGRHSEDSQISFVWRRVEADEPSRLRLILSAVPLAVIASAVAIGYFTFQIRKYNCHVVATNARAFANRMLDHADMAAPRERAILNDLSNLAPARSSEWIEIQRDRYLTSNQRVDKEVELTNKYWKKRSELEQQLSSVVEENNSLMSKLAKESNQPRADLFARCLDSGEVSSPASDLSFDTEKASVDYSALGKRFEDFKKLAKQLEELAARAAGKGS